MICSGAALAGSGPMTGSCAPTSWVAAAVPVVVAAACLCSVPPFLPSPAAEPAAAQRRLSNHRARTRHLWGGAASGAAIGAQHPRHARRPGRRHLRAGWLRRCSLRSRRIACRPGSRGQRLRPCPLFSPSVWGRFFGQTIDNHYQAFADPRASGNLGGFQGGIDLLRGSLIAGHYERAGLYGAYGDVNADVDGLVTNPAATAYVLNRTGSMNLTAWSAGGYWTHVGPGGWYLDAVLQGTWYYGSASTQFARLNTDGTGFIASLEGGYPFSWPQLGPGFVIEPQGQILWQKVSFRHDYDGLGDVALGDTTGPSGRIGLRTKWTIATAGGQVWQPYLRANLWRDWGAEADAVYSGTDIVPLLSQTTMLELGGGLTGRINANRLCLRQCRLSIRGRRCRERETKRRSRRIWREIYVVNLAAANAVGDKGR